MGFLDLSRVSYLSWYTKAQMFAMKTPPEFEWRAQHVVSLHMCSLRSTITACAMAMPRSKHIGLHALATMQYHHLAVAVSFAVMMEMNMVASILLGSQVLLQNSALRQGPVIVTHNEPSENFLNSRLLRGPVKRTP